MEAALHAARMFDFAGEVRAARPFGSGHINRTYCIECERRGASPIRYILQQINTHVFQNVGWLMENIVRVTEFLRGSVTAEGGDPDRECIVLIRTRDGRLCYVDERGDCWRAISFIENAVCYDVADPPELLYYSGRAFGRFQRLLARFPIGELHETISDFHNTSSRYAAFERAAAADAHGRAAGAAREIAFVRARKDQTAVLVDKLAAGELPLRVTHNDTKLNNVMLDRETGKPVCVIDLDTVMPGLSLYDYGDSIRFGANPAAEDERDLSLVNFDLERFRQFTSGFLKECGGMLTGAEKQLLVFSARLMTLECGMRFLTDHLEGDHYFRIHREGHNLDRCRTQLKLAADMEAREAEMEAIVRSCIGG